MPELRKKTIESWPVSAEVVKQIGEEFDHKSLLGFSRGKDSIACWLVMRDAGFEVAPYHNLICPGLEFVEESLDYYERFFGVHIRRISHPTLYRYLNDFVMQTPGTARIIAGAKLPDFDSTFTEGEIVKEMGWKKGTMTASGMRVYDNLARRVWLIQHGPIYRSKGRWCPVWDWRKAGLIAAFQKAGIKLPVDYALFGRSFDGLHLKYVYQIKKHFPADFKVLLEWFPLIEVELWRYERYGQAHAGDAQAAGDSRSADSDTEDA